MDKKKIIKKACGKGGPADKIRGGIKRALNLSDKIAKVGKKKIVPAIKGAAKGAIQGAKNQWKEGVSQTSKYDPSNIVKAGLGAVAGSIVGGVKGLKSPLSVPPLSKAAPTKLPSISQGAFKKLPTSVPFPKLPKSMPINKPVKKPIDVVKKLKDKKFPVKKA